MKTPIELAAEIISDMPTEVITAQNLKEVIVSFLRENVMPNEREHLILAFMEGQATPKASFEMWFNKHYKKTERTNDDAE
jgi:hypothetical protein